MLTTSAAYRFAAQDLARTLERTRAEPSVSLETAYYLDRIGAVKSVDDLIRDTRLFTYAMRAFGLDDMAHAKAFMRKAVMEGVADAKSFANRLADDRFVAFARTFSFPVDGEHTSKKAEAREGVVDRYIRQTLEIEAGQENEGVRLALYFLREAPTVSSAYGVLADPALWQVVKTVYGFPDQMANADIDRQAAAVLARLDISDLKDPAKLDRLIQRFTASWDATRTAVRDPVLSLFNEESQSPSLDAGLVMALNSLKHGGA